MSTELAVLNPAAVVPRLLPPCPLDQTALMALASDCSMLTVVDVPTLSTAKAKLAAAKKAVKALDNWIEEPKGMVNALHDALMNEYKTRANLLKPEIVRLNKEITGFEAKVREENEAARRAVAAGEMESWMVEQTALPVSAELQTRSTGWKLEVTDLPAVLRHVLEDWPNRCDLLDIEPSSIMKAQARKYGSEYMKMVPGIRVFEGQTTAAVGK